jgi:hypothetical protein
VIIPHWPSTLKLLEIARWSAVVTPRGRLLSSFVVEAGGLRGSGERQAVAMPPPNDHQRNCRATRVANRLNTPEVGCVTGRGVPEVIATIPGLPFSRFCTAPWLTYRHQRRDFRLTDVTGKMVGGILA